MNILKNDKNDKNISCVWLKYYYIKEKLIKMSRNNINKDNINNDDVKLLSIFFFIF